MTDRTPDVYLQAILNTLQGNDPGDVPPANWNYEQYLVAILNELKNGAASREKFVVTLTPTALDYSGTMDKTVAEINAAYEAGQEIWANISAQGKNLYIPLKTASTNGEDQYPSFDFCAYDIGDGLMILAFTAYTNDGTKQTYSTAIYSLTPAT